MAAKDAPLAAPTMAAEDAPPAAALAMVVEDVPLAAPTMAAKDAPLAAPTMTTEDAQPAAAPAMVVENAPPAAPTMAKEDAPLAAPTPTLVDALPAAPTMAENAPPAVPEKTQEEEQVEAEDRMREIGQRLGAIPEDDGELLRLLEEAELWLSRLNSPSESMHNALRPTMAALVTNQLLEHPDQNVSVGITSCLTEVTRLTAPDAPYDDSVMKVVFQRIVDTFGDLDNTNSPSFVRRHSILHTFARVRCCILMLDLQLDQMILDMFHHFFKTDSTKLSEHVNHCMQYIMMFVIDESDEVRPELASCLLQNLTNHAQETLPSSFELAKSVLGLCKDKLKPVLHELLKDTTLDEYSNVVTMLFQDASDAGENNVDASGKDMATEGKPSEKSSSIKAAEGESGKKEDAVSDKDTDEDISLKEMVSQTRIDKSKFQQEDSRLSSKRKRLQEAQETPLSKKTKMLDENLVGSRIKVWWPDDKMFYPGVISSYDASSNKHKVSYDDGDVEVLVLEKERYEFIAEKEETDPDASSNMRRGRRAQGCQHIKKGKMGTPQSDVKNPPKKRGRPKGVRSNNGVKSTEAINGSKSSVLSTKRKPEENEGETSEEKGSAKTTSRKKRRRKSHN